MTDSSSGEQPTPGAPHSSVAGIVGVYHADGGLRGEAAYFVGRLLGRVHCSLCDVTHSVVRRKRDWDAMTTRLGVPFLLVHLNEMDPDVADAVQLSGTPVVLGRTPQGRLVSLLDGARLDQLGGSVLAFERALVAAFSRVDT